MTTDTESQEQPDTTTATDGPMFMVVTLRSGAQIRAEVSEYTTQKNPLGALVGLKWKAAEGASSVIEHLYIEEVAAVHTERP